MKYFPFSQIPGIANLNGIAAFYQNCKTIILNSLLILFLFVPAFKTSFGNFLGFNLYFVKQ